jgi:hypothetical protein
MLASEVWTNCWKLTVIQIAKSEDTFFRYVEVVGISINEWYQRSRDGALGNCPLHTFDKLPLHTYI